MNTWLRPRRTCLDTESCIQARQFDLFRILSFAKKQRRVLSLNTKQSNAKYDFLYWQCRIRQHSARQDDGRPTAGMCPEVIVDDDTSLGQIVTLIIKQSPEHSTDQFRHMVKKTQDPAERWEGAKRVLSSLYYQDPKEFSDGLTALFGPGSKICAKLIESANCILVFEQNNQRFRVPCKVVDLPADTPNYQATFWHNSLFNPNIPGDIKILAFFPNWSETRAEPSS